MKQLTNNEAYGFRLLAVNHLLNQEEFENYDLDDLMELASERWYEVPEERRHMNREAVLFEMELQEYNINGRELDKARGVIAYKDKYNDLRYSITWEEWLKEHPGFGFDI